MAVTDEVIREILKSIDVTDDKLWTEEGTPLVGVVQSRAGDKSITRSQIDAALPGFTRVVRDETAEEPAGETVQNIGVTDTKPLVETSVVAGFDPKVEPEVNGPGEAFTPEMTRAVLTRRINDAQDNLNAKRAAVAAAQDEAVKAEHRLSRAVADCQRAFPAITAAENIKAHLAAHQKAAYDAKHGEGAWQTSQLDQALKLSNTRGWTRPVRRDVA